MATCPDCGERIVAMVCGRGVATSLKPETAAAIDEIIIAAHKKMGACHPREKETTDADT